MIEIFKNANYDFLGKKWLFIGLSWVLILAGLVSVVWRAADGNPNTHPFNMGIDFAGGSIVTVRFGAPPDLGKLRSAIEAQGIPGAAIVLQPVGNVIGQPPKNEVLVRLPNLVTVERKEGQSETAATATQDVDVGKKKVADALASLNDPSAQIVGAEAVAPQVGADLRNRAIYVTLIACIGMLVYVAFRFKSWGFGIGAIIAVIHDVLVTLGLFSIFQLEINLTVIAALLTLVGYSMNDTIVIFDRIREMLHFRRRESLETLSNEAINQTLSRTIITSGLTFLTVVALVVFGGEVLKSFSWCLFIGIIIGTYSSIYIASPFMLWWEGPLKDWWKKRKGESAATTPARAVTPAVKNAATTASSTAPSVGGAAAQVVRPAKKKKKSRPASASR
ncbi:MAG TPA: protein translocase subunit SecF [Blastocatellia bacterium]|nr:protein translocase subunit SecF [Blastocatellia bacterium]